MPDKIALARRWVRRNYRMALWVFGISGYVAGIEATCWPTAAKVGLMAAGTLFGGSEVIINLINNRDLERELAEWRGKATAEGQENAKLREEKAEWGKERAELIRDRAEWDRERSELIKENAELRRERVRERRGRYRRNRGLGRNGGE